MAPSVPAPLPAPDSLAATGPLPLPRPAGGTFPAGLHVVERPWAPVAGVPAAGDAHAGAEPPPVVVLVHGSLDRAASFTRTMRRLPTTWRVLAYDRRGYQGSREGGVVGLTGHVEDLLDVAAATGRRVAAVGHSMGGVVVLAAAVARPTAFTAVGAFEPPVPWLGFGRDGAPLADVRAPDPGATAEAFFRRMAGDSAWDRLPETARTARRLDGPALATELAALRRGAPAPFDIAALTVPAVFGSGGEVTEERRRRAVAWLAANVPGSRLVEIPAAGHGAHLTHPGAFADFAAAVVALGAEGPAGEEPARRGGAGR